MCEGKLLNMLYESKEIINIKMLYKTEDDISKKVYWKTKPFKQMQEYFPK